MRKGKSSEILGSYDSQDIAIIGMACRFPGAKNYHQFWDNLTRGINSIQEVPLNRWDIQKYYSPDITEPNKSISKWGGFLDQIDQFAAQFFNINPCEAQAMDPQQRLLLEETWHCIEDAGVNLTELQKKQTSIHIGVMSIDYHQHFFNPDHITDCYECLGNYEGILSNRLSYFFNFTGESQTVDAACASSLVSLHNARHALLRGECDYALVGGISVNCHPWKYISFSKAHMLSPDGQCKTFDAQANGYVPGEGVGVLLLCSLQKAIEKKYHIYGLLKGSAVKHTGKSRSITAPKVEIQCQVIKEALKSSGVSSEKITYVEAHGTGTSLGDPIEISALTKAFYKNKKQTCYIGAVKTNIGHLEAAAGVAGVIKVLLMLQHHKIPKTLNVTTTNPMIDFESSPFKLAKERVDWVLPEGISHRMAGISSFGFGGANAHVVLEEYILPEDKKTAENKLTAGPYPFILSAKTENELKHLIHDWHQYINTALFQSQSLLDISNTLMHGRSHFSYRFGTVVKNKTELALAIKSANERADGIHDRQNELQNKTIILRFNSILEDSYAHFKKLCQQYPILLALEQDCETSITSLTNKTILDKLNRGKDTLSKLLRNFVMGFILGKALLKSGLKPYLLIGDGIGILVTAVISEMLSFKTAIQWLMDNSTKIQFKHPVINCYDNENKTLISKFVVTEEYCKYLVDNLAIDAITKEKLIEKARILMANQLTFKKMMSEWEGIINKYGLSTKDIATHFNQLTPAKQNLLCILLYSCLINLNKKWDLSEKIKLKNQAVLEFIDLIEDKIITKEEVVNLLLDPSDAIRHHIAGHIEHRIDFIDSAKPYFILKKMNQTSLEIPNETWFQSVVKKENTLHRSTLRDVQHSLYLDIGGELQADVNQVLLKTKHLKSTLPNYLVSLWQRGISLDWQLWYPIELFSKVVLPLYPFEKQRYWTEDEVKTDIHLSGLPMQLDLDRSTVEKRCFALTLTGKEFYLRDHCINQVPTLPGAMYLEIARATAARVIPDVNSFTLKNVIFSIPIRSENKEKNVNINLYPDKETIAFEVVTLSEVKDQKPAIHSEGKITYNPQGNLLDRTALDISSVKIKMRHAKQETSQAVYAYFDSIGFQYGPSFQVIQDIFSNENEAFSKIEIPQPLRNQANQFVLHPSLLDGALQTSIYLLKNTTLPNSLYLPFSVARLEIIGTLPSSCYVYVNRVPGSNLTSLPKFNIQMMDEAGQVLIRINELAVRSFQPKEKRLYYYQPVWKKSEKPIPNSYSPVKPIIYTATGQVINDYKALLHLSQDLIQSKPKEKIQLICVANQKIDFINALAGFCKTLNLEYPLIRARVIQIHDEGDIQTELQYDDVEVRYDEHHTRFIKQYEEIKSIPQSQSTLPVLKKQGVYLITGGAGGLGMIFAHHLAKNYQAKLILTGRSELTKYQHTKLSELTTFGAEVIYKRVDVSQPQAVLTLVKDINSQFGTLNGIIHSAGVVRDSFILKKELEDSLDVLSPKIQGVLNIDKATKNESLDFFVLFSSIMSVFGNLGQCDYAYANGFMDAFAKQRERLRQQHKRQGKTIAINWPLWAEGGMQVDSAAEQWMAQTLGVEPLLTAEGIDSFEHILTQNFTQQIVLRGEINKMKSFINGKVSSADTEDKTSSESTAAAKEIQNDSHFQTKTEDFLKTIIAKVVKLPIEKLNASESFDSYGIDSVMILNLTRELEGVFGELSKTLFFEYQSLGALATYFIESYKSILLEKIAAAVTPLQMDAITKPRFSTETSSLQSDELEVVSIVESNHIEENSSSHDIAIIGLSGRYPQARDMNAFWAMLKSGKDCITEIPTDRWNYADYFAASKDKLDKSYSKWGGFIEDVDKFDPLFFNISPKEAELVDPQERLFLETAWNTIEDAGYTRKHLENYKVGVYVGVMYGEYQLLNSEAKPFTFFSSIANRVSYYFNFHGPSIALDTMCSSSLTTIHLACRSLQSGECQLALAGGVNVTIHPHKYLLLSQYKFLSSSGHCDSFGAGGDGYVPGEGVGAVLLKRLSQAIADGDHIYGVIKGSSVNHGGKTSGFTVPNPNAQASLIEEAFQDAHIDPTTISYIEAHGTGTSLGDPIEITALSKVFKEGSYAIGSVKSNIGHLESAAGIAGVSKILLQMRHQTLVPSIRSETLNPNIQWDKVPFKVQHTVSDWIPAAGAPRRAAISSFGAGGSNAHIILEEAPKVEKMASSVKKSAWLVTLSAKTEAALNQRLVDLSHFLNESHDNHSIEAISYTLNACRNHFKKRCAIVTNSVDDLKKKLESILSKNKNASCFVGDDTIKNEDVAIYEKVMDGIIKELESLSSTEDDTYRKNLLALANLYVKGYDPDWRLLHKNDSNQKISLPTYPFARDSYWVHIEPSQDTISLNTKAESEAKPPLSSKPGENTDVVLMHSVWSEKELDRESVSIPEAIYYVLTCGFEHLQPISGSNLISIPVAKQDLALSFEQAAVQIFNLIQAILQDKPGKQIVFQLLLPHEGKLKTFSGLSGLFQTAHLENPKFTGQVIELDITQSSSRLIELVHDNRCSLQDSHVRYVDGKRYVKEWASLSENRTPQIPWKEKGTYLITGGAGGIGLIIAKEMLATSSHISVILTGRSELNDVKNKSIESLQTINATNTIEYIQSDISSQASVEALIKTIQAKFGHLDGLIHSAGVINDNFIIKKTVDQFKQVLSPKVRGIVYLDEATRDTQLDFFMVFSSIAGVFGNIGQADYATANSFMDEYIALRDAAAKSGECSGKSLSIDWPLWREGGMQVDSASEEFLANSMGIVPMHTQRGIDALHIALNQNQSQVLVMEGYANRIQTFINGITPKAKTTPPVSHVDESSLVQKVEAHLIQMVSSLLKMNADLIAAEELLSEYGIESVAVMQFINQINAEYQLSLTPAIFYEYLTIKDTANYLVANFNKEIKAKYQQQPAEDTVTKQEQPIKIEVPDNPDKQKVHKVLSNEYPPIAIIGMHGVLPKSKNLDEFWMHLQACDDLITEVPSSRWNWKEFYGDSVQDTHKTNSKWGGFIDGVDRFDADFFNISPREAQLMDPQHRLFLETVWNTIESGGYDPATLSGKAVGLFAGVQFNEYQELLIKAHESEGYTATGNSHAMLVNRISYFLNLNGPSEAIDTACSSSLVAIHNAIRALHNGECELAIAGGITLMLSPRTFVITSQMGALSPDGRCKTFDKDANGYVKGEGAGAILLKPLAQARADKDIIYGIIRGSAVTHGGKSQSLTAPNSASQAKLLEKVYKESGINPSSISYIEAHGTGTVLGDPVEVEGLKSAFNKFDETKNKKYYCGLGSVKTNIGHLESAAGIASIIKILLALKNKKIPGSGNFKELNPYINLEESPFYIANKTKSWDVDANMVRRAGISSFGFGGAYAHILIEEGPEKQYDNDVKKPFYLLTLSAKNKSSLRARIQDMVDWLDKPETNATPLSAIAWTLNTGRGHFKYRTCFVADSRDMFRSLLLKQLAEKNSEHAFNEAVANKNDQENRDLLQNVTDKLQKADPNAELAYKDSLTTLAHLYMKGFLPDWNILHQGESHDRVALPTYPFAHAHYWIPSASTEMKPDIPALPGAQYVHPLLQENVSTLSEEKFKSIFTGQEFFIRDHQVNGKKIIPGVAYLEMVRAALTAAVQDSEQAKQAVIQVKNMIWSQPIIINDEQSETVSVRLYPDEHAQDDISFEVFTNPNTIHSQGAMRYIICSEQDRNDLIDIESVKATLKAQMLTPKDYYQAFDNMGLNYGLTYQAINSIYIGKQGLLIELKLPSDVSNSLNQFILHPSLLDSAFQASIALHVLDADGSLKNQENPFTLLGDHPLVPFALESMIVFKACTSTMWAWINKAVGSSEQVNKVDIKLYNDKGELCVRFNGLSSRALKPETSVVNNNTVATLLFEPTWQQKELVLNPDSDFKLKSSCIHVFLCGLGDTELLQHEVKNHLSQVDVVSLKLIKENERVEDYFIKISIELFSFIKQLLQEKLSDAHLIQVVVPRYGQQQLLIALNGLLKTVRLENPNLLVQMIATEATDGKTIAELLRANATHTSDIMICYEGGKRLVQNYVEIPPDKHAKESPPIWKEKGIYLITGGAGGLGLLFAADIASKVSHPTLILTGRTPENKALTADKKAKIESIKRSGAVVVYYQLDIADFNAVEECIKSVEQEYGLLNGIIHSAGIIADNFIIKKSPEELRQVLAPKVLGVLNLDKATQHNPNLDYFILFSALAAILGNPGQSDYALANAFLDAFAYYRNELLNQNKRHGQTVSINWPLWQGGGMTVDPVTAETMKTTWGLLPLDESSGRAALLHALQDKTSQCIVAHGDTVKLRLLFKHGILNTELSEAISEPKTTAQVSESFLYEKTKHYFKRLLSESLKTPSDRIELNEPLETYGIDSMMIMLMTSQLEKAFGSLSKTLFLEYQTLNDVIHYFIRSYRSKLIELLGLSEQVSATPQKALTVSAPKAEITSSVRSKTTRFTAVPSPTPDDNTALDIAIIGLSGKYPQAKDLQAYWENLRDGKDCITEVPIERWDWRKYYSEDHTEEGRHYSKWGGFIADVDKFDPLFFNISPREAIMMDPQERLFLEYVWQALEDAGYTRKALHIHNKQNDTSHLPGQVGVYCGVMYGEYQLFGAEQSYVGHPIASGGTYASIANRVSYTLNLHGPSMAVDTMCSSSLTAIHLACQDLKHGLIDVGIAGGVNLTIHPNKYFMLSQGQFISVRGRCESFGVGGEGYIPGEGVGVVLLKRLADALQDGDHIYGIIKGSAINHGGKTNGYTVPNPNAQQDVIVSALKRAQINPEEISYVEAHGTGTKLGDPIEITGLTKAFGEHQKQSCWIGSAKSNIGHCESAAGIAGLTKVLLQLQHKQIVPSLHSEVLNPNIDFSQTPFVVNQELRPWEPKVIDGVQYPRVASLSSFGAGGSNAHLIIEEYLEPKREPESIPLISETNPVIIPLSAKDEERLQAYAENLLKFIWDKKENNALLNLVDLAYTLQVGREAMDVRVAFVVASIDDLIEKLEAFVKGDKEIENCYYGLITSNKTMLTLFNDDEDMDLTIASWMNKQKYSKLLKLWVDGLIFDWNKLYGEIKPHRLSVTTYPFLRERYWITDINPDTKPSQVQEHNHLNGLLDENISTLYQQRYRKWVNEHDWYCKQHQINDKSIVPGAFYIAMAYEAMQLALDGQPIAQLQQIKWPAALWVNEKKPVLLELTPNAADCVNFSVKTEDNLQHCHGTLVMSQGTDKPERISVSDLKKQYAKGIHYGHDQIYSTFQAHGFNYGEGFKLIKNAFINENQAFVELALKQEHQFVTSAVNPQLLDAMFQSIIIFFMKKNNVELLLPNEIKKLITYKPLANTLYLHIKEERVDDKSSSFDIDAYDEQGEVSLSIQGFSVQLVASTSSHATTYFSKAWKALDLGLGDLATKQKAQQIFIATSEQEKNDYQQYNGEKSLIWQLGVAENADKTIADMGKQFETFKCSSDRPLQLIYCPLITSPNIGALDLKSPISILFNLAKVITYSAYRGLVQCVVVYQGELEDGRFEMLQGFGKSFHQELPNFSCHIVHWKQKELKQSQLQHYLSYLAHHMINTCQTIRFEKNGFLEKTLLGSSAKAAQTERLKTQGIYLITGGLGGLGKLFAKYLADEFNAHLILTGRSQLSPENQQFIQQDLKSASSVVYHQVDVSNEAEVSKMIDTSMKAHKHINGIIHSAGVLDDGLLKDKSWDNFVTVCSPKVIGTINLDKATRSIPLDFFCIFSSITGYLGNVGQCDYAAANAFVDEYVQFRSDLQKHKKRSGKSFSIAWPAWAHTGMKVNQLIEEYNEQQVGLYKLAIADGINAFHTIINSELSYVVVFHGIVSKFKTLLQAQETQASSSHSVETSSLSTHHESDLRQLIYDITHTAFSEILKIKPEKLSHKKTFESLGIDSIISLALIRKLEASFGILPKTLLFDTLSIEELDEFLLKNHAKDLKISPDTNQTEPIKQIAEARITNVQHFRLDYQETGDDEHQAAPDVSPARDDSHDIAIIGLSGRYPKANNLNEFWQNLLQAKDCITEIPESRWNRHDYYNANKANTGTTYCQYGGFIDDIDKFDPIFFNISPRDAENIDPQERLFLQEAWHALEDAGITLETLSKNTGVYVGVMYSLYQLFGIDHEINHDQSNYPLSSSFSSIANRLSFFLNINGPSIAVDSMCSSSLTALHLAIQSLRQGDIDTAIVGGTNLTTHPLKYIVLSQFRFLSPEGKCRSFGEGGQGYVPAEGVGAMVIKTLSKAIADGDKIYAVIKGSAINHGGRTNGFTVPNSTAQRKVIEKAFKDANVSMGSIDYIEAHGTGTALGDPVEISGLTAAFKESLGEIEPAQFPIGSVKSNIGHCESAAGMASISKVILQFINKTLVPSIHADVLNKNIDFEKSPFYVNRELTPWKSKQADSTANTTLRACISSFGAGGSNAHLIMENFNPDNESKIDPETIAPVFILSTYSEAELFQYAEHYYQLLSNKKIESEEATNQYLYKLLHDLQHHREAMPYRLAITATHLNALLEALKAFIALAKIKSTDKFACNQVQSENQLAFEQKDIDQCVTNKDWDKVSKLWVLGADIAWPSIKSGYFGTALFYPFKQKKCWYKDFSRSTQEETHFTIDNELILEKDLFSEDIKQETSEAEILKNLFHDYKNSLITKTELIDRLGRFRPIKGSKHDECD